MSAAAIVQRALIDVHATFALELWLLVAVRVARHAVHQVRGTVATTQTISWIALEIACFGGRLAAACFVFSRPGAVSDDVSELARPGVAHPRVELMVGSPVRPCCTAVDLAADFLVGVPIAMIAGDRAGLVRALDAMLVCEVAMRNQGALVARDCNATELCEIVRGLAGNVPFAFAGASPVAGVAIITLDVAGRGIICAARAGIVAAMVTVCNRIVCARHC